MTERQYGSDELCVCGHTFDHHHHSWVMNEEYAKRTGISVFGDECLYYGSNEDGGMVPVHRDKSTCEVRYPKSCRRVHDWEWHCGEFRVSNG